MLESISGESKNNFIGFIKQNASFLEKNASNLHNLKANINDVLCDYVDIFDHIEREYIPKPLNDLQDFIDSKGFAPKNSQSRRLSTDSKETQFKFFKRFTQEISALETMFVQSSDKMSNELLHSKRFVKSLVEELMNEVSVLDDNVSPF